jgi:outer membrane protein TolC
LNSREINIKAVRNAMLPTLDLFAYYGGSGLGGTQNPANICPPPPQTRFGCHIAGSISPVGYGGTLNDLVNSAAPDKGVGLTLNIPLRNRAAQGNQVRAELEYHQAQVRRQQIENQVRIEVRNAQFTLRQNRAAVEAARAAVEFARQSLDSEQKKLQAGVSTPTLVLQNQSALTTNESNLVSAMAAYEKSRVELDRATGTLLDHAGIQVADAERGQVTHMPNVPYVAPRQDLQPQVPPEQPQQQVPPTPQSGQM